VIADQEGKNANCATESFSWRSGMSSLAIELEEASALHVTVGEVSLAVDLADGRTIIVPLVWYPRLWYGTPEERSHFEITGGGTLIHWPDLDEDLSVAGLLTGRRSGESQKSLKRWLAERTANPKRPEGGTIEA
jgi:hypothetical protein